MEKINNYRINSDSEESEFFLIERTVDDGVVTEGIKLSSPYKEEIEKIVTLYEQHFKMLEALKLVEGGMIQIRQCEANGYPIDTIIKDIKLSVEQTIKECEL